MMQRLPALLFALVVLASPALADTLRVAGAGSLTESFSDLLRRFPAGADTIATPEFGPSGLMREKIDAGLDVDLFASADMEQARRLAAGHPDRMVINFTRQSPVRGGACGGWFDPRQYAGSAARSARAPCDIDPGGRSRRRLRLGGVCPRRRRPPRCPCGAGSQGPAALRRRRQDAVILSRQGSRRGDFSHRPRRCGAGLLQRRSHHPPRGARLCPSYLSRRTSRSERRMAWSCSMPSP